MSYGIHPAPSAVIAHLSDPHLLAGGALLADLVDTEAHLRATAERLRVAAADADAIVVSGDIADRGEAAAYELAREILEPVAEAIGAPLVWAAGNHDERPQMRAALGMAGAPLDPIDTVAQVGELRIVSLDTSLPGWHHGGFDAGQAEWLAAAIAEPPALGTVIVMHHPPLPYRSSLMRLLEFRDEARLAEVLGAGDVRAILSGHLHINGSGTFAEIPVVLAGATSYADDLGAPPPAMHGIDATQSFNLVEIYPGAVAHSVVPALPHESRETLPAHIVEQVAQLSPDERMERFSRKPL
ncbi:metallophosphoesterase [Agrococcus baldri]|uniref:3',5'-cyclic adenosine monophosphate phosphodiesterase CpdA n=1 Tax=Agrococcus baldri TaxID=153730 RepID=A0AA87RFL5_9MICO|nr:metallophosphoesterase [Agrococcus baldri]GEK78753.1 3',5'-cyclic adenosine monophosphate phosphodiesterase CpdA [Agrococcus baldri]